MGENDWLNREADRLEATMASMSVPIRVSGGRIQEGRVRYHATPIGGVPAEDMQAMETSVATALGAESVAIQAARGGVTIDVRPAPAEPSRLLPLVASLGPLPSLTTVAGVDSRGVPVLLNLNHRDTWHLLLASDAARPRSAWLRSMVAGLTLNSRPSEVQLAGVDLTGNEQAFIEAVPHALADVAFRPDVAIDLLAWLRDEAERRRELARRTPHMVIVVDNLSALVQATGRVAMSLLNRLLSIGVQSGVHVIAGWDSSNAEGELFPRRIDDATYASIRPINAPEPLSFEFEIVAGSQKCWVRPADVPVGDLDKLVRDLRMRSGRSGSRGSTE